MVVVVFALPVLMLGPFKNQRSRQDRIIGAWARLSLWLFGVKIEVNGFENLPRGGYVALFNHTSNFDILVIQSLIPHLRFGAKIELFRIPIFGHAMRASKALPIARAQRTEVMKVYEEAKSRLRAGECFALSPEGTRQASDVLAPFKAGPFLFAINAQVPLVPIALAGALNIQGKSDWIPNKINWVSTISVSIGAPISTQGYDAEEKSQLQGAVREAFYQLGLQ